MHNCKRTGLKGHNVKRNGVAPAGGLRASSFCITEASPNRWSRGKARFVVYVLKRYSCLLCMPQAQILCKNCQVHIFSSSKKPLCHNNVDISTEFYCFWFPFEVFMHEMVVIFVSIVSPDPDSVHFWKDLLLQLQGQYNFVSVQTVCFFCKKINKYQTNSKKQLQQLTPVWGQNTFEFGFCHFTVCFDSEW